VVANHIHGRRRRSCAHHCCPQTQRPHAARARCLEPHPKHSPCHRNSGPNWPLGRPCVGRKLLALWQTRKEISGGVLPRQSSSFSGLSQSLDGYSVVVRSSKTPSAQHVRPRSDRGSSSRAGDCLVPPTVVLDPRAGEDQNINVNVTTSRSSSPSEFTSTSRCCTTSTVTSKTTSMWTLTSVVHPDGAVAPKDSPARADRQQPARSSLREETICGQSRVRLRSADAVDFELPSGEFSEKVKCHVLPVPRKASTTSSSAANMVCLGSPPHPSLVTPIALPTRGPPHRWRMKTWCGVGRFRPGDRRDGVRSKRQEAWSHQRSIRYRGAFR
jgi:hypothetical protein